MMRVRGHRLSWKILTRFIGALSLIVGLMGVLDGPIRYPSHPWLSWVPSLHETISSELIAIGLTVLIIDFANEKRAEESKKRDLTLQMGSSNNTFAREAERVLKARGWLYDGTLRGADLRDANLIKADLQDADLRQALLCRAELVEANLTDIDLRDADLRLANLYDADLIRADLRGADLTEADLRFADLTGAKVTEEQLNKADSLLEAIMPKGTKYGM